MTTPEADEDEMMHQSNRDGAARNEKRGAIHVRDHWILLLCAALFLWNLNYAPFGNPDEGRYSAAALEMAHPFDGAASDWIVPHLNTIPRLNKPPLIYWLSAASFRVLGANEWAGRLVPALCAVVVLLLAWSMGRVMFGRRAGLLGALVWATSLYSFGLARLLNTDMLLCACMTLGLWGIWRTLEEGRGANTRDANTSAPDTSASEDAATEAHRDARRNQAPHEYSWAGPVWAGVGLGLALLAKGPVGMALPLLITFVYLCAARRWHRVPWLQVLGALILAVVIAAPWYLAVMAREPDFLRRFFLQENLSRFSGKGDFHAKSPFYYYIPIVLVGMLPWTPFLFFAAWRAKRDDASADDESHALRARLFLWLWAGLLVLFFSASGTKLPTYVLPAFPALALLAGKTMDDLSRGCAQQLKHAAPRIFLGFTLLVDVVLAVAALKFLSNDKILPRREGLGLAALSAGVLVAGSLLSLWAWRGNDARAANAMGANETGATAGDAGIERRWKRLIAAQAVTIALLYASLLHLAQHFTLYEDAGPMIQALAPYVRPGDRFVEWKVAPQFTPIFHLNRPVEFVGFKNNSGLNDQDIARSPFFAPDEDQAIGDLLSDSRRVFVMLRRKSRDESLPPGAFLVARNSDFQLVSNRPAPSGFAFDHVAPGKETR